MPKHDDFPVLSPRAPRGGLFAALAVILRGRRPTRLERRNSGEFDRRVPLDAPGWRRPKRDDDGGTEPVVAPRGPKPSPLAGAAEAPLD
jgi:hypothetical protein